MIVALINNNIVTSVLDIGDDEIPHNLIKENHLVVDVTDQSPPPAAGWELYQNKIQPLDLTRLDVEKYKKRAAAKDGILSWMAATNVERLRLGIWTFAELSSLTLDTSLKLVLDDVNTLSFELALGKIDAITNPLITTDIKNAWKQKLIQNLF